MKIAILGTGNVGKNLGKNLIKHGYEVIYGSRTPESRKDLPKGSKVTSLKDAVEEGEVVVLAVPFHSVKDIIQQSGLNEKDKIVIDVTNALTQDMKWAVGFSTSGAEEIAKMLPKAKVVKAFNTIFAENMSKGKIGREKLAVFIAGDDQNAKEVVKKIAMDLGFDPIDAGDLTIARYIEPLALLLIHLGYNLKMGTNIGFKLIRKEKSQNKQ